MVVDKNQKSALLIDMVMLNDRNRKKKYKKSEKYQDLKEKLEKIRKDFRTTPEISIQDSALSQ